MNLTALFILQEIEDVLATYPKEPYQVAFFIPYWQQKLMVYIPNQYTVVETRHYISRSFKLLLFPVEEYFAIENFLYQKAIISLLQNYKCSVQDIPIDTFSLNFKTDSQLLYNKSNNSESFLTQNYDFLQQRYKELEQRYREISILNKILDFLQICNSQIAIYQGLTFFLPSLFLHKKGVFLGINYLNGCLESISIWEVSLDDEPFLITPDFDSPCKLVEFDASRCNYPAILGYIKANSLLRFVIIFLAKLLKLLIYFSSAILWELSNYLKCKIREKVFYKKR